MTDTLQTLLTALGEKADKALKAKSAWRVRPYSPTPDIFITDPEYNDAMYEFEIANNPDVVIALVHVAQHCNEFVNGESVTYGEVRKALARLEQVMKLR